MFSPVLQLTLFWSSVKYFLDVGTSDLQYHLFGFLCNSAWRKLRGVLIHCEQTNVYISVLFQLKAVFRTALFCSPDNFDNLPKLSRCLIAVCQTTPHSCCQIYQCDLRMRFPLQLNTQIIKQYISHLLGWRSQGGNKGVIIFMPHVNTPQTSCCCFSAFVLSSLSWTSSLSSPSSPCALSSPSSPGLVINSCRGSTSSLPPAGGRLIHCWLSALWCSVCGAARLSLRICLCTSPKETTLTPHSPEGYLQWEESIIITLTLRVSL